MVIAEVHAKKLREAHPLALWRKPLHYLHVGIYKALYVPGQAHAIYAPPRFIAAMALDKGHLLPAQERLTRVAVNVVEVRTVYGDAVRLALYAGIQPELARGVVVKYGEPRGPHQELVNDRPRYRLRLIHEESVALGTMRSVGFFN